MISIITPTYNRGYILPRLYDSLLLQSINNFEWIVIDDGSKDETETIVNQWIENKEKKFDIHYVKKENGGKHRALNVGIAHAKYNYIFIVDSDDYLVNDALNLIQKQLLEIKGNENFAGVSGLKGKIVNSEENITALGQFPKNKKYLNATNLERRKYKLNGDKAEVYRKDLLLKYPFPEFENENFIGEDAVWNQIAKDNYKIRWFNSIICICEYLDDGLTKQGSHSRNSENFNGYTYTEKIKVHFEKFPYNILAIGRYLNFANEKKLDFKEIKKNLNINNSMLLSGIILGKTRNIIRKAKIK